MTPKETDAFTKIPCIPAITIYRFGVVSFPDKISLEELLPVIEALDAIRFGYSE